MEVYKNGHRYYNYNRWEQRGTIKPYDYERYGLLKHLLSHKIIESKNQTLQYFLQFLENTLVMLMKLVERLKNFKNYAYTNR